MQSGKLRHIIQIQKPTAVRNGFGQQDDTTATWNTVATVWAQVVPKTTVESMVDETTRAVQSYDIRIRFTADVKNDYRVIWDGLTLNIESITKIFGIDKEMRLTCFEQLAS